MNLARLMWRGREQARREHLSALTGLALLMAVPGFEMHPTFRISSGPSLL